MLAPPSDSQRGKLVRSKAIKEACPADPRQIWHATARCTVREIPEIRTLCVADQVRVANDSTTFGTARPIVTGLVVSSRKCGPVVLAACENVMLVWRVPSTVDDISLLIESRRFVDFVVIAMQVLKISCDLHPLGVVPRTSANPVPGVGRRCGACRLSAEIGPPRLRTSTHRLG